MLPKISATNYEKCYPKNLNKLFRSHLNMKTYDSFIPHMERAVIGNLPPEIINYFSKDTRARDIKNFQNVLSDITKYLRASYHGLKFKPGFHWVDENYRQSSHVKDWMKEATVLLNACLKGLHEENKLSGKIEYVDRGAWKNVFKLSFYDKNGDKIMHDKALGVYHSVSIPEKYNVARHGNFAEANFWGFLKFWTGHKMDNTAYTRHYISDMKSGYSLTEFAGAGVHKTTSKFDIKKTLHIKNADNGDNSTIYGKYYDAGGHIKQADFIDDKVTLRYYKKLLHRSLKELPEVLGRYKKLAQNPKTPNRDKIQKALDLFESLSNNK